MDKPVFASKAEERRYQWGLYWRGLAERPVPVDHERIARVGKQIREYDGHNDKD